jgi:hypothetical protein
VLSLHCPRQALRANLGLEVAITLGLLGEFNSHLLQINHAKIKIQQAGDEQHRLPPVVGFFPFPPPRR